MNLIRKSGLTLFLLCLVLFVSLLSVGKFKLSPIVIENQLNNNSQKEALVVAGKNLINTEYTNQYAFIQDLKTAFQSSNKHLLEYHGLSSREIDRLVQNSSVDDRLIYSEEAVIKSIIGLDEVSKSKRELLKSYTSWFFQKEFTSEAELRALLTDKVAAINQSTIEKYGFNKYTQKELLFSLSKASTIGFLRENTGILAIICFLLGSLGALMYILPKIKTDGPPGIKNNNIFKNSATNKGLVGIITGTALILFYIMLYWYPWYMTNWVLLLDPVSRMLNGSDASRWFLYGFIYTLAMIVMGVRMIIKYRHNRYQLVRTYSVVFFQLGFAFILPEILVRLNQPYMDFKNMWPLDYDFFFNGQLLNFAGFGNPEIASVNGGAVGIFMLVWGIILFTVGVPILTFLFGKRFYCSWVCGCGGLAETVGDPYRQLSDKSLKAWKIERWLIYAVLVFVVLMTALTLYTFFSGKWSLLGIQTTTIQSIYGFLIGAAFAGVVGTGFYPLMGNRVWCRFGCPLAGYIGIVQRFKSRFRITTNGGQCISCGNCSTYCEMGIDVRWYAQRGQNIVRSSCVGCGICSAVCPRGVLKLENGPMKGRMEPNGKILVDIAKDIKRIV